MNPHYKERFLRSFGIVDENSLRQIQNTRIAIGGLGLGGSIFLNLVRMGFEKFHISDPDTYERTNINRQRMAKESTVGVRKDEALLREALDINPDIQVKLFPEGLNLENVGEFLEGVDWVVDVVDVFAMNEKLALNEEAHRRGLPVASCGSLGFAGAVVVFDKHTPSFAELTGLDPAQPYETNVRRFVQFICPDVPDYMSAQMERALKRESHIPFVVPGVEIAAAVAVSEISKHILGIGKRVRAPYGIFNDPIKVKSEIFVASHKERYLRPVRKAA